MRSLLRAVETGLNGEKHDKVLQGQAAECGAI